ncbi:hypothetical protein MTR67_003250 [Solanum verrucosum]|uniref:Uncharacterized protein n=1 Tax=Solanum verrucosum TaxID=315347 RepID=A0AAF0TDZ4_SOLVR|nr:hypothetical protein MTR67_003250 [Solanum verrucosum]
MDQWLHELVSIEVPRLVVGSQLSVLPVPTFEEPTVTCTSLLVVPSLLAYHRHPHLAPFSDELCHASNNVATTDLPPPSQPIAFQKESLGILCWSNHHGEGEWRRAKEVFKSECNMSYQQRDEVYYIEDEYEMEELDYFVDEFQGVDLGGFDSVEDELQGIDLDDFDLDVDEYDYMNKRM